MEVGDVSTYGDSSQNFVGNLVSGDVVQSMVTYVRGRSTMYLGSAEIDDRVACYVRARNHDLIVKALEVNPRDHPHRPTRMRSRDHGHMTGRVKPTRRRP